MFIIDGMDGIEAGFHFAGIVGISPRRHTLRQLWRMAEGVIKNGRRQALELATMVWSIGSIDAADYLHYGIVTETGRGGPVQLEPDLQAKVEAEVEKTRRENPGLPSCTSQRAKG